MKREIAIGRAVAQLRTRDNGSVDVRVWLPGRHTALREAQCPSAEGWAHVHSVNTVSEALAKAEALAAEYLALDATARACEESTNAALEALLPPPANTDHVIQAERARILEALRNMPHSKDNRVTLKRVCEAVLELHVQSSDKEKS